MNNEQSFTYQRYTKNKKKIRTIELIVAFGGLLALLQLPHLNGQTQAVAVIVLFALLKAFDSALLDERRHNYRTWGRGAGAELKVSNTLEKLGPGYRVINDIQTGRGNIDHVCVGPTGIFVIETKAHYGTISFTDEIQLDGVSFERDYLKQVWAEVFFVRDLLQKKLNKSYRVQGILEFSNAQIDASIHEKKRGIWVGGRGFSKFIIQKGRGFLSSQDIEEITTALR